MCSQWIACHTKVKQHYRLSHQAEFEAHAAEAIRLCTGHRVQYTSLPARTQRSGSQGLPPTSSVLWQISLMSLKQSLDRSSHGTATGNVRTPSGRSAGHDGLGDEQKGSRQGSGPFGPEQGATHGTGKGTPGHTGPSNKQHWRRAGGKGRHTEDSHPNHLVKALARLALQQETALKILRQDYSWALVQPGNQGPLPLLFAAAQKWKKAQEEGTTTALRTSLLGCLIQMLHTGLKDIGGETMTPFQKKAEEMKWLKEGQWCYRKWSPALGSLVVDETKGPLKHAKCCP